MWVVSKTPTPLGGKEVVTTIIPQGYVVTST